MKELDVTSAADITPVTTITDTEAQIDMVRLRSYRLQRLRQQLVNFDVAGCVLFSPLSIRYATGVRNCALFHTHIVSGYLFVPAVGPVILFDAAPGQRTAAGLETVDECRDALPLNFMSSGSRMDDWARRWAAEMADLIEQHGGGNRRLAVERAGTRATLALAASNVDVVDGMDVIESARKIKGPEEIMCINYAIAVAEAGMWHMRDALEPGKTELQVWNLLWQANIKHGGDWLECRLFSSGDRINPWQQEASHRLIRPNELVAFDTDMIGPFGYAADVSRTFFSGPGKPNAYQKELYQRAHEEVHQNLGLMRPGMSFKEITEKAYSQPERFVANRYPVLAHGVGMCDEWPAILYPQDYPEYGYDGVLEPGMVMSVESYVGEVGGPEGVKLEQQIVITEDGHKLLCKFPFEEELLA